jgi:hypothetical protein
MKQDILVVTATLGNRDSLEKTVQTVAENGRGRVKHIIVAPADKCSLLTIKYPQLEILPEPTDCKSIYIALNYGLMKYADSYEYLTFINDDDYWLPNYIDLITCLDKKKSVDVAYGKVKYVDENGEIIGLQTCSGRYKAFKALLKQGIVLFTQQAVLMRSNVFIEIGGFDEKLKLVSDTKFWLDAINKGFVFQYLNFPCAAYMLQPGQLSSDGKLQKMEHDLLDLSFTEKDFKNIVLEKFLFRMQNIGIYCQRFYKNKKIKKMEDMFNQK